MNRIATRFGSVIRRLDDVFREAALTANEREREILLSFLVVKLHDQWNYRSRQVIFESCGRSEASMTEFLRTHWSSKRFMDVGWEPDWHVPSNAIRAATLLNVPDLVQIRNALGGVTVIEDIRWTRNAIAHNVPTSFRKFHEKVTRRLNLGPVMPYSFPAELNPSSGKSFYEDWCEELHGAISVAI